MAKQLTLSKLKAKVQSYFNKFIRERDKNSDGTWTCISCGKIVDKCNASHYANVKAHPHLRYEEDNCHASCIACNRFFEGRHIGYRRSLIKKIGEDRLLYIEKAALNSNASEYTREQLHILLNKYKNK